MDTIRFGRGIRALRRRRGWRQLDLARAAGVSQSLVARLERGGADRMTVRTLERIASSLGARALVRLDFNGEAIDRLLDADHASLVEQVMSRMRALGWHCATEVTFAIDGERGSVDVLAFHPGTAVLLVIEVKTVVPDLQAMLGTLDRKVRLGRRIARQLDWSPVAVGRLLVFSEDRTSRRRVAVHGETFRSALPDRSFKLQRSLRAPDPRVPPQGLLFLPRSTHTTGRHRIQRSGQSARAAPRSPRASSSDQ